AGTFLLRPRPNQSWIASIVPAVFVIGSVVAITVYERAYFAERFRTIVPGRHLFWHPIHVGLAANPNLAREYSLTFDDLPAHLHVFRYVTEAHDTETLRRVFGGDDHPFDYSRISWRAYDGAARTVVTDVVRRHPKNAIQAFVYYKPLMLFKTL